MGDVKEIFAEAIGLPLDRRAAFLDDRCAGNQELRAAVERLITLHEQAGRFLGGPTMISGTAPPPSSQRTADPQHIGDYKLIEPIGEGGFGTVYLAEQQHPVRRRVALKLIKLGMDTQQVVARFEAERQALAMMDHPSIAKVFGAGATETGRPYFVMELVSGIPVTQYCDANRLTPRQRLELFIPICQAVQHAHQKGIIHRDLKPSNVLVALQDGRPVPKVIDFGIAKAIQVRLTERSVFTELSQMIGTPEYMSPEQAQTTADDADTRTDIYSLGVLLYELLTGATPFDAKELRSRAFDEIQRVIREVEPPNPSTRLSRLTTLANVAAQRNTEPVKLRGMVRGELDWIVMKCLEKERARRYDSAAALAADVMHYLADEPVAAAAPSRAYRFRKFVRRNKGPVIASVALVTMLFAGITGTTIGLIGQSRQRRIAENQRAIADAVSQFQSDMLASADPEKLLGNKVTVLQTVQAAVKELDTGKLRNQPLVEARVRETIGNTLRGLGSYDEAEPNLRKAVELRQQSLAPDDPDIAESLCDLAWTLRDRAQFAEAEVLVRRALAVYRRKGDERNTAATLGGLAVLLTDERKFSDAETFYREALMIRRKTLPAEHYDIARNLNNLAAALFQQDKDAQAEEAFREALAIYRKALPAGHPQIADNLNNLGMVLADEKKFSEAEQLCREALDIRRRAFPAGHQNIGGSLITLAGLLREQGEFEEAEQLAREGLEIYRKALPPGHPNVANAIASLAKVLQREGKYADAEPLYREAIAVYQSRLGKNHVQVAVSRIGLGISLGKMNRLAESETELLEAERVFTAAGDAGTARVNHRICLDALVALYTERHKAEPGEGYDEKAQHWKSRLLATTPATLP